MSSYKIKVNEAWAWAGVTEGPFELWRINPKTEEKERVKKSEVAPLIDRLDELLTLAGRKKRWDKKRTISRLMPRPSRGALSNTEEPASA